MLIHENETYRIIGAAMEVHKTLGCGFTEKVYQDALEKEFILQGIPFVRECSMQVSYKNEMLTSTFAPDFVYYDNIIVELKAVEELSGMHESQAINYAHVADMKVALLINFGTESLEHKRLYNPQGTK